MEKWLYEKFISLGGNPKFKNPFYFTLQKSDNLHANFDVPEVIEINLNDISASDISFTFDDSMAKFYTSDWKPPFLKNHLFEFIYRNENSIDKFLKSIQPQYLYIEAQLWTDKYFDCMRGVHTPPILGR